MKRIIKSQSGSPLNYILFAPQETNQKLPLIVFLHGSGERGAEDGSHLDKVLVHGLPKLFLNDQAIPAIMVVPQCPDGEIWDMNVRELKDLILQLIATYPIDENKITLTGLSMGGFGSWAFACTYPTMLAGLVPICGGGMPWRAHLLGNMPIKVFHGAKDDSVDPVYSQNMVDKLTALGYTPDYTLYPNVGHNAWDYAYTKELLDWLLAQDKRNNK